MAFAVRSSLRDVGIAMFAMWQLWCNISGELYHYAAWLLQCNAYTGKSMAWVSQSFIYVILLFAVGSCGGQGSEKEAAQFPLNH